MNVIPKEATVNKTVNKVAFILHGDQIYFLSFF